jgi:hypothetical protein
MFRGRSHRAAGDSGSAYGDLVTRFAVIYEHEGRRFVARIAEAAVPGGRRLRPLLDLPVELVLPAHGEPTDRAALERVLS